MTALLRRREREDGSILIFILGLSLLLLLVAASVLAVSSVYLERQRLQSLADQMALTAAQQVEGISDGSDGQAQAHLTAGQVLATSSRFLQETGAPADFSALVLDPATGLTDSQTARVVLRAQAHPPLSSFLLPAGVEVQVVGQARVGTQQTG